MAEIEVQEVAAFTKGGVTPIEVVLQRTGLGVKVIVKTTAEVENFMLTLGGGRIVDVERVGRNWRSAVKDHPLQAYELVEHIDPVGGNYPYRVDALGSPLSVEGYMNLSFLRLVGSSEGIGASFYIKGVYSLQGLRNLKDQLVGSTKQFYIDYMRPVDLIIKVSTQELRGPFTT